MAIDQKEVTEEKTKLDDWLEKVREYIKSEEMKSLPFDEQSLLVRQENAMFELAYILSQRIERFPT